MGYFRVPINNGLLDIDYAFMENGIQVSENSCVVKLRPGYSLRPSWTAITEQEFLALKPPEPTTEPEPTVPGPTLEEQIDSLKQDNLILMDALATTFEEILLLREQVTGGVV